MGVTLNEKCRGLLAWAAPAMVSGHAATAPPPTSSPASTEIWNFTPECPTGAGSGLGPGGGLV